MGPSAVKSWKGIYTQTNQLYQLSIASNSVRSILAPASDHLLQQQQSQGLTQAHRCHVALVSAVKLYSCCVHNMHMVSHL